MVLDRLARLLVLAAFLAAQATALAHSIWHVASAVDGARPIASAGSADGDALANPLCAQHGALDDVLGALHGAIFFVVPSSLPGERAVVAAYAGPGAEALTPSSRGPPTFL